MVDKTSTGLSALNSAAISLHEVKIKELKIIITKIGKAKNLCRREKKLLEQVIIDLRKDVRTFQTIINRMNRALKTANVPVMGILTVKPRKVTLRKTNVVKGV